MSARSHPPPPLAPGGPAIVTTLRDAGAVIDSFIAYHLAIGFAHFYLYFDDPTDPDFARLSRHPRITAIRHDRALREAWEALPDWPVHRLHVDQEVMSRQVLNLSLTMRRARADGYDYLLHIDSDELFYSPHETAAQHFAGLKAQGVDVVGYRNYEAAPETDESGDFFRQVTLFKRPPDMVAEELGIAVDALRQVAPGGPPDQKTFFNFYINGKSAVGLARESMISTGVHSFGNTTEKFSAANSRGHFILHYACCGFQQFWDKYARLGGFSDKWWGAYDITDFIGHTHLRSRDMVASGDKAAALDFYRRVIAFQDPATVTNLLEKRVLERIAGPAEILAKAPRR